MADDEEGRNDSTISKRVVKRASTGLIIEEKSVKVTGPDMILVRVMFDEVWSDQDNYTEKPKKK